MTYTREQIEKVVLDALSATVDLCFDKAESARHAVISVGHQSALATEILERLDLIQPEPTPAPKENADEKRRLFIPPSEFDPDLDPDYVICVRCKMYRCNHRRCGDLMVCTRPR